MITTLEIDAERVAQAEQYANQLGLDNLIDFKVTDALYYLQAEQDVFDFILLDAERDAYVIIGSIWPDYSSQKVEYYWWIM